MVRERAIGVEIAQRISASWGFGDYCLDFRVYRVYGLHLWDLQKTRRPETFIRISMLVYVM